MLWRPVLLQESLHVERFRLHGSHITSMDNRVHLSHKGNIALRFIDDVYRFLPGATELLRSHPDGKWMFTVVGFIIPCGVSTGAA